MRQELVEAGVVGGSFYHVEREAGHHCSRQLPRRAVAPHQAHSYLLVDCGVEKMAGAAGVWARVTSLVRFYPSQSHGARVELTCHPEKFES